MLLLYRLKICEISCKISSVALTSIFHVALWTMEKYQKNVKGQIGSEINKKTIKQNKTKQKNL